jgi:hypothetical protein
LKERESRLGMMFPAAEEVERKGKRSRTVEALTALA